MAASSASRRRSELLTNRFCPATNTRGDLGVTWKHLRPLIDPFHSSPDGVSQLLMSAKQGTLPTNAPTLNECLLYRRSMCDSHSFAVISSSITRENGSSWLIESKRSLSQSPTSMVAVLPTPAKQTVAVHPNVFASSILFESQSTTVPEPASVSRWSAH
jgi:hypothetical protein